MLYRFCLLFVTCFSTLVYGEVHFSHRVDSYATHQPVLYEMCMQTNGPIIEFGSGHGSTDLLHAICKEQQRELITIDDNQQWLSTFSQKYLGDGYEEDNSGWHKFLFVPGKNPHDNECAAHWVTFLDSHPLLQNTHFAVCFVDQSPWQARLETIKRFRSKTKYIILHDCDYYPEYHKAGTTIVHTDYGNSIPGHYVFDDIINYSKLYYPLKPWPLFSGPPTLLGSDFVDDFPEIDYNHY
ncbi:MAG: hypothetical protein SP1CHLAM54_03700 [Chlamydiia bacterium]|nr:hypothetical protein [Chlamydiia bacterium]MCH9615286.1 hypothetical protein [Chlamydiia bacterium]MCH9628392.1 hypothetical protein [Chlamydiia bacterium]